MQIANQVHDTVISDGNTAKQFVCIRNLIIQGLLNICHTFWNRDKMGTHFYNAHCAKLLIDNELA